ncbi:hypothetical protein FOZ60_007775 [Perkinsus olseni]|uniref:Uncharacterized protein n=1 Tax=Perkinsus olseni TaxID=32597 RepID=A0A7J6PGC0_PEROL|nr:hypothetical protein FOZ60_007775 [Perkinsus olseni]
MFSPRWDEGIVITSYLSLAMVSKVSSITTILVWLQDYNIFISAPFTRGGSTRLSLCAIKKRCEVKEVPMEATVGKDYVFGYDHEKWENGMWFAKRSEKGRLRTDRVECSGGNGGQVVYWDKDEGVACMDEEKCFVDPVWAMNIKIPRGTSSTRETFSQKLFLNVFKSAATGDLSCDSLRRQLCLLYKNATAEYPVKTTLRAVDDEDRVTLRPKLPRYYHQNVDGTQRRPQPYEYPEGQTTASRAPSSMAAANLEQLVHHRRPARYNYARRPRSAPISDDTLQDTLELSSYESTV